jgi:diguanylate cyclase
VIQLAGVLKNESTSRVEKTTNAPRLTEEGSSPATRLASSRQKHTALWACGAIVLVTVLFAPIASTTWPLIPAFVPAYQTAIILAYAITAYLTFAHYRVTGSSALLHLSGYCFYTGAILIAQFATFPGLFIPNALLFGGTQSTIWLWFFWHLGTPAGILLSMLILSLPEGSIRNLSKQTRLFVLSLIVMIGASIAAAVIFGDVLPVLDNKGDFSRITTTGVAPALEVITAAALFLLWRVTRFKTVLQVWLGVALIAMLCDNAITMMGAHRLSVVGISAASMV